MKKWLHEHLWNTLPEHIIWFTFGALILMLSGATPEEWINVLIEKLPPFISLTVSAGALALITRVFFGLLGIFVIVFVLASQAVKRRRMLALAGMIVFGCGFIICAAWYFWPTAQQGSATAGAPSALQPRPTGEQHPATVGAPSTQQPSRRYTKADAERMLSALFDLYDTINSNVDAMGRVDGFWLSPGQQMHGKSIKEKIDIATRTRERVHNIAKDIYNVIIPKYQYYADDLRPLIQGDGVISQTNGALNDFIDAANLITDTTNDRLIKLALEPKQTELDRVLADFVGWARDSRTRIATKRSEIESQGQ
jgi:hypothetical protein